MSIWELVKVNESRWKEIEKLVDIDEGLHWSRWRYISRQMELDGSRSKSRTFAYMEARGSRWNRVEVNVRESA